MFIRNGLVLAFALAWTSVAIGFGPQEGSQDSATIRRVQEAMQANRDAFTEFRVEFEVTSGSVASEEDALAGKFVRPERATAIWARFGEDETFRIGFAAREPVVAPVEATQVKANGKPMREIVVREAPLTWNKYFVSRGDYFAIHTPMSKVCAINKKVDAPWFVEGLKYNPFGFDLGEGEALGPYVLLKACVGGKRSAVVESIAPTDQDELVTISIQGKDSKESRFRIWASKNWNYLPREYSYHSGNESRAFVIKTLEAVKAPGGHWFPTKVLRISSPDNAKPKSAVLLVAKSIQFDVADTELDGVFEVEAGTQFNVSGKQHFFVSSQAETVSLANLGGIYQKAVAGGIRQKLLEQGAKAP